MTRQQKSLVILDSRPAVSGYKKLVTEISSLYDGAKAVVVRSYWEIGKRLVEVEQDGSIRAAYGAGLIKKLSKDLTRKCGAGLSDSNLRRMRQFYLCYPQRPSPHELTWAQYVELLPLEDKSAQTRITQIALRENLSARMIRQLVQSSLWQSSQNGAPPELLLPIRGTLHAYQVTLKSGELYLDLGFRNYRKLEPAEASSLKEGAIVTWNEEGLKELAGASAGALYTYEAKLERVCDGDTQWYFIFAGRGVERRMKNDKLRLRGIDCSELVTPEGKRAKRFVEELFGRAVKVTVVTTKPDKYDRYLSDIFLEMKEGGEVFLNNELLAAGHAFPYKDPEPEDWDDVAT